MKLVLPSRKFIEQLHEAVLQNFNGRAGTLHPEVLDTVIARPKHYVTYDDCNLHKVCAVMVHTIAQDHPFTDANKRTALLTIIFVYQLNGVSLEFNESINGDFTSLLLWIVQEKPTIEEICDELQQIVEKYAKSGLKVALERIIDFFD